MRNSKVLSIVMFGFGITAAAGCTDEEPPPEDSDIAAVAQQSVTAPDNCLPLAAIAQVRCPAVD